MRSLIISVIILCLTLSLVSVNAFTVDRKLDEISESIKAIYNINDEKTAMLIDKLTEKWEKAETQLSLTTNRKILGEVEHQLAALLTAFYEKESQDLILARSALTDLIAEIRSAQIFDIKSVL